MKPWTAVPAVALALLAAACSGNGSPTSAASGTSTASTSPSATPSATPSDPLVGTWETDALPTDKWVATFRRAGAPSADLASFASALASAGSMHTYLIRILDGHWVELDQHDGGTPSVGWDGTYTAVGDKVLATEKDGGCHVTYQISLGADTLSIHVLSDLPEAPPHCGRVDTWFQRSIYETAVFHRQR